ncbi:MAG: hypothetical protein B9S32_06105 [Verrucomicrobia bacterium Tous-C9LFEB]|nr:MAG: hypothetical protein B9S32_06105 [Verrucomicrobia bacterium Tous-C9LFEB]
MKKLSALFCLALAAFFLSSGTVTLHAQTADPAKIAALQARFKSGVELFNAGKNDDALKIFDAILVEEPKARGSLFFSAFIQLRKGQYETAATLIDRFLELEPRDFKGIVLAIQANQALHRTAKVEALRKTLFELERAGSITAVPGLTDTHSMYIRERILLGDGRSIIVGEYFNYKKEPFVVYLAEQIDTTGNPVRRLVLSYAPDAKDANVESFALSEYVIVNGEVKQINIYRQDSTRPDYETCRRWMLEAIKNPPKPIYSAPITGTPAIPKQ